MPNELMTWQGLERCQNRAWATMITARGAKEMVVVVVCFIYQLYNLSVEWSQWLQLTCWRECRWHTCTINRSCHETSIPHLWQHHVYIELWTVAPSLHESLVALAMFHHSSLSCEFLSVLLSVLFPNLWSILHTHSMLCYGITLHSCCFIHCRTYIYGIGS